MTGTLSLPFITIDAPNGAGQTSLGGINNVNEVAGGFEDVIPRTPVIPQFHGFSDWFGDVQTLDVPNAYYTTASGINDEGQIVGSYGDTSTGFAISDAYLDTNGTFTTIAPASGTIGGVPFGGDSYANGINDFGVIVGDFASSDGFVDDHGVFKLIDYPNSGYTSAIGINNLGQVVGGFGTDIGAGGFLYANGKYTLINPPGETASVATGINDFGIIVGNAGVDHGFVDVHGLYVDITLPGAITVRITGINDAETIVGTYTGSSGGEHGFAANLLDWHIGGLSA